jgi:hypothetical protein
MAFNQLKLGIIMDFMKKFMKTVDLRIQDERQRSMDKGHEFEIMQPVCLN